MPSKHLNLVWMALKVLSTISCVAVWARLYRSSAGDSGQSTGVINHFFSGYRRSPMKKKSGKGLHSFSGHFQTLQNYVGRLKSRSHPAASPPQSPAAVCREQIFLEPRCLWVHLASGFLRWVTILWHYKPADSPQSETPFCSHMTSLHCLGLWWSPGDEGERI